MALEEPIKEVASTRSPAPQPHVVVTLMVEVVAESAAEKRRSNRPSARRRP
jgi:hypothetical protein